MFVNKLVFCFWPLTEKVYDYDYENKIGNVVNDTDGFILSVLAFISF